MATDAANREREALESHWIALLSWFAQQRSQTPEDLLEDFSPDMFYAARQRHAAESRRYSGAAWSILSFVDFGRFSEIASKFGAELEKLGRPPKNWRAILDEQNKDTPTKSGLVGYRNHLAHGTRFGVLPEVDRQKAIDLFGAQQRYLEEWWPDCPFTDGRKLADESRFRPALRKLLADDRKPSTNPADLDSLVRSLGFGVVPNSPNLVPASLNSDLARALAGLVSSLHRVGNATLGDGTSLGFYAAYLQEWPFRSADREKVRRKVAQAIVTYQAAVDPRRLIVLIDGSGSPHAQGEDVEIELLLPRSSGARLNSTTRAALSLTEPNRYHVELLDDLALGSDPSRLTLPVVTRQWSQAFSVERVTRSFYEEFRTLRDRIIEDLLANNADNPALQGKDRSTDEDFNLKLHAFGSRQLGRLLFLWFLQQKRWLGDEPGHGDPSFLTNIFRNRDDGENYFADVLVPLFFDGLGRNDARHRAIVQSPRYGSLPYLGGGLFRPGADDFERELLGLDDDNIPTRRVIISDDLFDPAQDETERIVGKKRERSRTVLGLLRGYRFTTQESTPDDQSVDPDPELLGKVFENLYQQEDRHKTGAYYTPREIVHYMCREALDGYLVEKTGLDRELIRRVRTAAVDWDENERLGTTEATAIVDALDEVKILDPAVGSGAFLLAAMQEIVLLRRGLLIAEGGLRELERGSLDVTDLKRRITVNNLYGVDINPMAVEICQLRLWLSMLVDLDVNALRDIHALPNLDFRIVAGDSLVDRIGKEPLLGSWPVPEGIQSHPDTAREITRLQDDINRARRRFENEGSAGSPALQRDLKQGIREKETQIARLQLQPLLEEAQRDHNNRRLLTKKRQAEAAATLAYFQKLDEGLKPDAAFQKPFLWPVNFPEVLSGPSAGFDIVLANPPYVRQEGLDAADQIAWSHAFKDVHAGTADLLVYFFARAVQLLRPGGQLAFITSNKYMRAAYGESLRGYLPSKLQVRQVIDFGDLPLFSVAAYPAVVIAERTTEPDPKTELLVADLVYPIRRRLIEQSTAVTFETVREELEDLETLLQEVAATNYPQSLLRKSGWILEDPALVALFDRLMKKGTPLGEYVKSRMYYGIKTGLNEAFVIDQAKRDELVAKDPRSAEVIKPWLRGRDIKRWKPEWDGLYIIAIQNSGDADAANAWGAAKSEAEARRIFADTYPAIHEHLSKFELYEDPRRPGRMIGLRPRADQGKWWWELRACAYYAEFERPKIIWPEFARQVRFALDTDGILMNNKGYLWADPPSWMLPVLNSELIEFMLCLTTSQIRGSFLQLYDHYVRRLAVVEPSSSAIKQLDDLAGKMRQGPRGSAEEDEIEALVRTVYGLTGDDSQLVDDWFRKRSLSDESTSAENDDDQDDN